VAPHVASRLTFLVAVDDGAVEVLVVEVEVPMVEVEERIELELDGVVLPEELRYQLAVGSPRHSPRVTAL
jgi:hypothetical protein